MNNQLHGNPVSVANALTIRSCCPEEDERPLAILAAHGIQVLGCHSYQVLQGQFTLLLVDDVPKARLALDAAGIPVTASC